MRKSVLLIIAVLLSVFSFGQQKKSDNGSVKLIQKTYYYSFADVNNQEDMNGLVFDLERIKDVVKVKLNYKPEKEAGEVIVIIIEPERTAEGEVFFSPKQIKDLIIQHHLTPGNMSVNEVVVDKK